jgi:thymidylate synthase
MKNWVADYESQYKDMLGRILREGVHRDDRTGVGCRSAFNLQLNLNVEKYFPVLVGKKMFPNIFNTEFAWFINGETNIKRLQDAKVTIWDEWADENGDLGPVYGHQLRNFNSQGIDQLENLIDGIKNTPDSRRHVVSLWNPAQIAEMALPPCYLYFQFFVEGDKLNMFAVQRSGDAFLGIPYDVALFTNILNYVAVRTNLRPSKLDINIIDAHIYDNHLEAVKTYLNTTTVQERPTYIFGISKKTSEWWTTLINYKPGPAIKAPVAI